MSVKTETSSEAVENMAHSSNNVDLFKAVVLGDLEFLKSSPSDTDWNNNFTFEVCGYCLCGLQIERFTESHEVMLSLYEEAVRNGRCMHCKGGSKAADNNEEMLKIMDAVIDNYLWEIESFMTYYSGKKIPAVSGANPLHLAVMLNHKHIVTWLLQKPGVNIHGQTERLKEPPLNLAVFREDKDMVKMLLNVGADPNEIAGNSLATATMLAIEKGQPEILDLLIQHGADINYPGIYGVTPIDLAVTERKKECAELLVKAGADTSYNCAQNETVLNYAVENNPEMVKILLKGNVDVNEAKNHNSSYPPLVTAILKDKLDMVKLLLEHGADVNKRLQKGDSVLQIAVHSNHPSAVDLLLEFGADVNHTDDKLYTTLHYAALEDYVDICQKLLAAGAECDALTECKNTPLSLACLGNSLETIKLFLSHYECNVDNRDKNGNTPLHYTTYNSSVEATKLLISKGGNPAIENLARTTPLWNAIYKQNMDIIKLLLDKNVPVDIPSRGTDSLAEGDDLTYIYRRPKSPLYLAAKKNLFNVPTMIVLSGLDLSKEIWLYSGKYPANLRGNNNENEMVLELDKIAQSVFPLQLIARSKLRRTLGLNLPEIAPKFEIPHCLVNYLLLKE